MVESDIEHYIGDLLAIELHDKAKGAVRSGVVGAQR